MRRKVVGPLRSLKRPKLRQDWSKWNLYNVSRLRIPPTERDSYFQQKWKAKAMTRAYHGEHIRTKAWNRLFSRSLPSVVPMDHRVLARSDGSDQARGRGRGEDVNGEAESLAAGEKKTKQDRTTPYMQMAFHPLERRLDTAIWRALFSSSVRQARMMCTQGHVKVNGKRMLHPSYRLNPGDMFSVTPKVVLEATGAPKFHIGNENQITRLTERAQKELKELRTSLSKASQAAEDAAEQAAAEEDADADEANAKDDGLSEAEKAAKKTLRDMRKEIQAMLKEKQELSNKQKRLLRDLRTDIPRMMSKKQFSSSEISTAQQRFTEATSSALAADASEETAANSSSTAPGMPSDAEIKASTTRLHTLRLQIRYLVERWREYGIESGPRYILRLQHVMTQLMLQDPALLATRYVTVVEDKVAKIASEHNTTLKDVTKRAQADYRTTEWSEVNPYSPSPLLSASERTVRGDAQEAPATPDAPFQGSIAETAMLRLTEPWRPRDYMSAFAFIPRYLEVNQNVCSAVYLRHPVARPGLAEVPTPFPEGLNQLAFNWFLRRR